ncbi:MAG TPA: FmdB family zinc ribbon protein [Armatimonadota bacterium]|jgi:putative FmdB family regulatory protein
MPMYDYKCEKCGHRFEVEHGLNDPAPKTCVAKGCGGQVSRVFTAPAIMFKGKGWHVNDYGRSGSTKPAPACAAAAGGGCAHGKCPAASTD